MYYDHYARYRQLHFSCPQMFCVASTTHRKLNSTRSSDIQSNGEHIGVVFATLRGAPPPVGPGPAAPPDFMTGIYDDEISVSSEVAI